MSDRVVIVMACALGLAGCGPASGSTSDSGQSSGSGGSGETGAATRDPDPTDPDPTGAGDDDVARPGETPWRVVVDGLPFPADITALTVGGREYSGNFANRGDVEVFLDQDTPVISVEMRVYDFANDLCFSGGSGFEGTSERMALWAYAGDGNPQRPDNIPPEDDCTVGTWKDNCHVRVYFDGLAQPLRSGADLRVHLPRSYRGALTVVTEDNFNESTYPRLGDVVVDGICGSGSVSLSAGRAAVKLCRDLTPAPTCPAEQVALCEAFTDEMGEDAAWSPSCPCPPDLYGQLLIEARAPYAGDITVDVPGTTWMNVHAANQSPDKPHACVPEIADCTPGVCTLEAEMYAASAEYNYPSPAAPAGAGYNLSAVSAGCGPVKFFDAPEDWVDEDSEPTVAEHGHIRVCTDCL